MGKKNKGKKPVVTEPVEKAEEDFSLAFDKANVTTSEKKEEGVHIEKPNAVQIQKPDANEKNIFDKDFN